MPFHFENFIHFGSAESRLKNFKHKLNLLETYASQSGNVNNIPTGNNNIFIKNDKGNLESKKQKIIKSFDGYEYYLYYIHHKDETCF